MNLITKSMIKNFEDFERFSTENRKRKVLQPSIIGFTKL